MKNVVVANFAPLEGLIADLEKNRDAHVRVGILASGGHVGRENEEWNKEDINNPTLGLVHEFGSASNNIPPRSFLRVPLATELPTRMRQIGKKVWQSIINGQGLAVALKELGIAGENVVQGAFNSNGYGRWQAWSASYAHWRAAYMRKRSKIMGPVGPGSILILSGQLAKSITSEVKGAKER
jgi:hypothetical protein